MVKPITKETLFMNCIELDFATKIELEHWIATFEEKVWNKDNHRITRIFEYENEKAYRACQAIIEKKIMSKAKVSYNSKIRNNRGIIFYDYRS